jgi:hypothetical protein
MIQITDTISWDETKKFYEQSPETQQAMNEALQTTPLDSASEPCGRGMKDTRLLWATYAFGDVVLEVTNTYLYAPTDAAWGALRDVEYTIVN